MKAFVQIEKTRHGHKAQGAPAVAMIETNGSQMRVVLGGEDETAAPDILIEHTTNGWLVYLHKDRDAEPALILGERPEDPNVECQNCGWQGREQDGNDIKDYSERVAPGEESPVCECPECGALCHYIED